MADSFPGRLRRVLRVALVALLRGALLAITWVVLAGWDLAYAGYGAASVAAATVLSLALFPVRDRPREATSFRWRRAWAIATLPLWFIGKSVAGGADVAWRALQRPTDVEPVVVSARCALDDENTLQLALLMMNLMPGTMVQRLSDDGSTVELHALSEALKPEEQWDRLQRRVAAAFGQSV